MERLYLQKSYAMQAISNAKISIQSCLQQIVIKPGTRTPPPTPSNIKSLSFSSPRSGRAVSFPKTGRIA